MEEKKNSTGNISTILLVIALIIIVILCAIIYKLISERNTENQIVTTNSAVNNLQNQIASENTTTSLDEQSTVAEDQYIEIKSRLGRDDLFVPTNVVKNDDNSYILKGFISTKLTMTKAELEELVTKGTYSYYNPYGDDPLYVDFNVKKNYQESANSPKYDYAFIRNFNNEDRVYLYATRKDTNNYYIQNGTEYQDEWKLTEEYKKITLPGDLEIETDDEPITISEKFKDFVDWTPTEKTQRPNGYTFEFSNGKCTKVTEVKTGH